MLQQKGIPLLLLIIFSYSLRAMEDPSKKSKLESPNESHLTQSSSVPTLQQLAGEALLKSFKLYYEQEPEALKLAPEQLWQVIVIKVNKILS